MDVLMELEHLKACADEGSLSQVYNTLMHLFQSTILNTHKSENMIQQGTHGVHYASDV